jgi:lipid A ethanolaminephosphotransferase
MDISEPLEIKNRYQRHPNGFFRSGISAWKFNLLLSIAVIGVYNLPFWHAVLDAQTTGGLHTWVFIGALTILVTAGFNLLISLCSFHPVHKIITVALLLTAAITQYFTLAYGVVIDKTMMLNVFQTDPREFTELIDIHLLLYFTGFGFIPAYLVGKTQIIYGSRPQQLKHIGMAVAISFVVTVLVAMLFLKSFAPFFREHRELRFLLNPANVVYGTGSLIMKNLVSNHPLQKIGQDAQLSQEWRQHSRKTVLVIIIGETARAHNFSLNGYQRQTNPLLSKSGIFYFHNVASCGTATASSLPCIFSKYSRSDFNISTHRNHENLLDITLRAGLRTIWIDNNSGCKGLCTRIEHKAISNMDHAEMCNGSECFDEILVTELDQFLSLNTENAVVVLHQKGSHGPAYYLRVPEAFKRFTPVCESVELKECTQQEIVNTYGQHHSLHGLCAGTTH